MPKPAVFTDPIVVEVREIRERLFAQSRYNLHRLMEQDRAILKTWKGKVVTKMQLGRGSRASRKHARPR